MISPGVLHPLEGDKIGSVVVEDEGIVKEGLKERLVAAGQVENTLWRHDVTGTVREGERVVD